MKKQTWGYRTMAESLATAQYPEADPAVKANPVTDEEHDAEAAVAVAEAAHKEAINELALILYPPKVGPVKAVISLAINTVVKPVYVMREGARMPQRESDARDAIKELHEACEKAHIRLNRIRVQRQQRLEAWMLANEPKRVKLRTATDERTGEEFPVFSETPAFLRNDEPAEFRR